MEQIIFCEGQHPFALPATLLQGPVLLQATNIAGCCSKQKICLFQGSALLSFAFLITIEVEHFFTMPLMPHIYKIYSEPGLCPEMHTLLPPPGPAETGQLLSDSLSSHRLVIGMCLPLTVRLLGSLNISFIDV